MNYCEGCGNEIGAEYCSTCESYKYIRPMTEEEEKQWAKAVAEEKTGKVL